MGPLNNHQLYSEPALDGQEKKDAREDSKEVAGAVQAPVVQSLQGQLIGSIRPAKQFVRYGQRTSSSKAGR